MRCIAKSHTSPRGGSSERGRGGLISPAAGSSSFPERRPQCNHYKYRYNSTTTSTNTAGSTPDDRGDHPGVQEAVWQTKARDSDAESDDDASGGEEERGEEEEEECDEQ